MMASGKDNTRAIRPTPSRRSNFLPQVPAVIYSQTAADFRPPADYVGPRKSVMQRPPDPSMNPKKLSLPILSVSKLDVQIAAPPTSKTSLPRADAPRKYKPYYKTSDRFAMECVETGSILRNMPSSFRKQFRSELQKKGPYRGKVAQFFHRDFHNQPPPEPVNLNGIIVLKGSHRIKVEEVRQEPGTPPPLSGRRHCVIQTDTYLEDIADNETGFNSVEMQCEPIYDEILEANPLNFETKNCATAETQLDQGVFADIDQVFEQFATNLADAVIMESLKQLQEEFELEALRKQHEYHKCLRNREMSILAKYKAAQEKYQEQKRLLQNRQPWEQTLDQIIQLVGFDKIRDIAPLHFIGSQTNQAVYEHVVETMVPPLNSGTELLLGKKKAGRNLLDNIIEDSVLKREAEYAGKMYIRDPKKKGSLATESPSRQSLGNEWLGEGEYDAYQDDYYDDRLKTYETSQTPGYYNYPMDDYGARDQDFEKEEVVGDAWEDINTEQKRRSSESTYGSNEVYDDDDV